jgi:mRNA interferase RelE/StbE
MSFELRFHELAWAEWKKLDGSVKTPLKKKLLERLREPRVPSAALSHMPDCYKIKLRQAGYRLVYRVDEQVVFVTVIAVGKRDKSAVYASAASRQAEQPQAQPQKTSGDDPQ